MAAMWLSDSDASPVSAMTIQPARKTLLSQRHTLRIDSRGSKGRQVSQDARRIGGPKEDPRQAAVRVEDEERRRVVDPRSDGPRPGADFGLETIDGVTTPGESQNVAAEVRQVALHPRGRIAVGIERDE